MTKLENVHLINFAPSRIRCNRLAVEEYNRLRKLHNNACGLGDITEYNKHPYYVAKRKSGPLIGGKGAKRRRVGTGDDKNNAVKRKAPAPNEQNCPAVKRRAVTRRAVNVKSQNPPTLPSSLAASFAATDSTGGGVGMGVRKRLVPKKPFVKSVPKSSLPSLVSGTTASSTKRVAASLADNSGPAQKRLATDFVAMSGAAESSTSSGGRSQLPVFSQTKKRAKEDRGASSSSRACGDQQQSQSNFEPVFCKLPNRGNECYATSALECFGACPLVMKRIWQNRIFRDAAMARWNAEVGSDDVSVHLESILVQGLKRVDLLRKLIGTSSTAAEFGNDQQQDAAQFFCEVAFNPDPMVRMTIPLADLFEARKRMYSMCERCMAESVISGKESVVLPYIELHPKHRRDSLHGWLLAYGRSRLQKTCDSVMCIGAGVGAAQWHVEKTTVIIPSTLRYLLVQIERRDRKVDALTQVETYPDLSQPMVDIGGDEVTFKVAVQNEFNGEEVMQGIFLTRIDLLY